MPPHQPADGPPAVDDVVEPQGVAAAHQCLRGQRPGPVGILVAAAHVPGRRPIEELVPTRRDVGVGHGAQFQHGSDAIHLTRLGASRLGGDQASD